MTPMSPALGSRASALASNNHGSPSASLLLLPGVSGNWASTPDSAAASVTGDLDLRVRANLAAWVPVTNSVLLSKAQTSAQSGYDLYVQQTTGFLVFRWTPNGATASLITATSTVATGIPNGTTKWVRATLDVDNGAAGNTVTFYTSDDGATWTQLGAAVVTAGVTSIFDGSDVLGIGAEGGGTSVLLTGAVFRAQVRNGIGGTLVVDFDPTRGTPGSPTVRGSTGELWTINRTGATPARLL